MEKKETELSKIYKQAEAMMLVRNQDEFVTAIGISRATLYRYNKFPEKVPPEVIERAKTFLETKKVSQQNVVIQDIAAVLVAAIIRIEAKINILFSKEAERSAKDTAQPATDVLRQMNAAVRLEVDDLREGVLRVDANNKQHASSS